MKTCSYYFQDGMINITNLDQDKIKIDEKSYLFQKYSCLLHWIRNIQKIL